MKKNIFIWKDREHFDVFCKVFNNYGYLFVKDSGVILNENLTECVRYLTPEGIDPTKFNIITIEDLLKKKSFPEKWLIRVKPEHINFWNTNFDRGLPSNVDGYISSDNLHGLYEWGGYFYWHEKGQQLLNEGYVQISFKEFNEHYFGGKGLLGKEEIELETIIKEKNKMSVENAILEEVTKIVTTDKQIEEKLLGKLEKLGIVPSEKVIILKEYDKTFKKSTVQHSKFETVLKCLDVRSNLALVGPAGSGKTTIVEESAKVLDLPFYSKSVSVQTGTHEFFGYYDANGNYVPTLFRKAYEEGGIFLLDEFDAGNPNVLAALNQSVANNVCPFPDAMVSKHKDFIMVIAGNTFGTGATMEYVGRNKIDAATLDRFVFLEIPYDNKFEMNLAKDKEWCKEVQEYRKRASDKGLKVVISPRATFYGEMLLLAGLSKEEVLKMTVFKGLTDSEVDLLRGKK